MAEADGGADVIVCVCWLLTGRFRPEEEEDEEVAGLFPSLNYSLFIFF